MDGQDNKNRLNSAIFKTDIVQRYFTVYREFSRREILAKMTLGRCVKFSLSSIFAIQGLSMNTYIRILFRCVYFCRFQGGRELGGN